MPRFLLAALLSLVLDLTSKYVIIGASLSEVMKWDESSTFPIILIPHLLSIQPSNNVGVAFSLPITGVLLKVVTVGLIAGVVWHYARTEASKRRRLLDVGYGMVVGGALGNGIERIFLGQVTDFIAVEHFAILNFADSMITCGVVCILLHYFYESRRQ